MEVGFSPGDFVLHGDHRHPSPKRGRSPAPNSRPIFIVGKQLDGSRWHLAWRSASAQRSLSSMGTHPLPKKGAEPPIFGPCLLRPNGWIHQDATWYWARPRTRRHCARWGPNSPPQKGGRSPQFSAHVYCGQTAAWIKMPLGTEVGLVPDLYLYLYL